MNILQQAHLTMDEGVSIYCRRHEAELNNLANFPAVFTVFTDLFEKIKLQVKQQYLNKTGIAAQKMPFKQSLIDQVMDSSRKLHTFAHFTNKTDLLTITRITETELKVCSDDELYNIALGLFEEGERNIAELVSYGITGETQNRFNKVTNEFSEAMVKWRISVIDKKNATKSLAASFKELDQVLNKLDLILEIVHTSNPDLYAGYREMRKIKVSSRSTIDMKIVVKDALTNDPIRNAQVIIAPVADEANPDFEEETIERKTAEKGGCYEKSLSLGAYTITASRVDYFPQTINTIFSGEGLSEIEIKLTKKQ
jgi:hypothetical protein